MTRKFTAVPLAFLSFVAACGLATEGTDEFAGLTNTGGTTGKGGTNAGKGGTGTSGGATVARR